MADEVIASTTLSSIFSDAEPATPVASEPVAEKKEVLPTDDSKKESSPSPVKAGEKSEIEQKVDIPPVKTDEKKDETKPSDPPIYDKSKAEDPFEKRFKDTQAWGNKLREQNIQHERALQHQAQQIEILKKQIADPEYDPATDPALKGPSQDEITSSAINVGKALASRNAAYVMHGEQKVNEVLGKFKELFDQNPIVNQLVMSDDSPVLKAMEVIDQYDFGEKYGKTPKLVYENIKKEVLEAETKVIEERVRKEILEGVKKKGNTPTGLSGSGGSNGLDKSKSNQAHKPVPLESIFGQ